MATPALPGGSMGANLGMSLNLNQLLPSTTTVNGTQSQRRVLSQEAIDQLIYSIMSSDQGLAALAGGENMAGGYNSSAKGQQAQDLVAKLLGELAIATSETVTTTKQSNKDKGGIGSTLGSLESGVRNLFGGLF